MITASASRVHPTCEVDPDVLASELFGLIESAIAHQPRSLQRRIGPSEIGVPCDRRIGYKLAGTPGVNRVGDVNWKAYIGTSIHEQFADIIARSEADALADPAWNGQRWHVEEKVSPGLTLDGVDIDGSCDLFDAHNGAVWDWKVTTRNKIRETYRPHGVGSQYEVQAQLYGHGWALKGYEVRSVGVIFFTRDGEFTDRHVWHQPYDPEVAARAIARVTGIPALYLSQGISDSSMTYVTTTQQRLDLHAALLPFATAVEERLSFDDVTGGGVRVEHDFAPFLRVDPKLRADLAATYVPLGVYTVEEARALEGFVRTEGTVA